MSWAIALNPQQNDEGSADLPQEVQAASERRFSREYCFVAFSPNNASTKRLEQVVDGNTFVSLGATRNGESDMEVLPKGP